MSIIENKLKVLKSGEAVTLIHSNGTTIDGIVKENDGVESLSIEIRSEAIFRYSSIVGVEFSSLTALASETRAKEKTAVTAEGKSKQAAAFSYDKMKDDLPKFASDLRKFNESFNELDGKIRSCLYGQTNEIRSANNKKDLPKIKKCIDEIQDIIDEKGLDYDPMTDVFIGYSYVLAKMYKEAAESFVYGDDFHNAFSCAITNAIASKNKDLYNYAGAFAALYIVDDPRGDFLNEALNVLDISSNELNDLSAISFVADEINEDFILSGIMEALRHIAGAKNVTLSNNSDIDSMMEELRAVCSENKIIEAIKEFDNAGEEMPAAETEKLSKEEKLRTEITDLTKEYVGKIVSYNFFEHKGIIEGDNGNEYPFESKNIPDREFREAIDGLPRKDFDPVPVRFYLSRSVNSFYAIKINNYLGCLPKNGISYANELFNYKEYEKALSEYEKMLKTKEWEEAFLGMMNCYLAIDKQKPSPKNINGMRALVDKYRNRIKSTVKSLSILNQYYMKIEDYPGALKVFSELIDISGSSEADQKRKAFCYNGKAKCYRKMDRIPEAIEQIEEWLKIVAENKLKDYYSQRDNSVYPKLGEMYFQIGDYDNAERYALLSQINDKKALLEKIEKIKKAQSDGIEENYTAEADEEDEDDDEPEAEIYDFGPLDRLEKEYVDSGKFESLEITDNDIIEKAFTFDNSKLYCMVAYLSAAAYAAKDSEYAEALKTAELCVRAASGNLRSSDDHGSTSISYLFSIFRGIMPDKYEAMFAAAALRALFEQTETPDYEINILTKTLGDMELAKRIPAVLSLASALLEFRNQTGYGLSEFADYKTDKAVYERMIDNAKRCRESIDKKLDVFESKGRLRRTREILFIDPDGILRSSLDAACDNDTGKLKDIKAALNEKFVRSGKAFEYDNIDKYKIDDLIDTSWNKAKEIMLSEKRHVNRPHEKLIDPKRRNVIETIKKVLKCVFEWIELAEKNDNKTNYHAKAKYAALREDAISYLGEIKKASAENLSSEFDWGYYFLESAADELLMKVNGTYDDKTRKYMYIDFLRTDHILLDDNYQPELYATFNSMSNFNVLNRIEKHMEAPLPKFADRIDDLFSNDISKNNLRSASLIRAYGEDMGISEITDHNMYNYLEKCIVMGRSRLKGAHEDFLSQLELYRSYGSLSDINDEKTTMEKEEDIFFRICFTNYDFGFYANLIDAFNENISVLSQAIADRLNKQLDELELNTKYDWGIFNKDEIKSFIDDRNFSVAENMMNCIRRNDTQALTDYSIEPFGHLEKFIDAHLPYYRAVSNQSYTLKESICRFARKGDIELAMRTISKNVAKDVRGGVSLIKNWITTVPAGTEKITRLMEKLGLGKITVQTEAGASYDSYIIRKEKQTGRVNYHYPLPAFSSDMEQEGARVVCLYGKYDANRLIDKYKEINTTSKHTIVLLDYALNLSDRRDLAKKLKEERSFSKTFILIDRVVLYYLAIHYQENTVDKVLMSVTLPFSYYQPFSAVSGLGSKTMPPELYTGRAAELMSIENPEGCNLVYGGRQLGKSALLSMAARHVDGNSDGDRAIVVDIVNRDYKAAALTVSAKLVDEHILPEGSECNDWDTLARHISRRLADDDPKTKINFLLLMLDEADEFIESCKDIKYTPISVFKNLPKQRFKLVMAGLHNLSNFNRKVLYNNSVLPHLEYIIVRPFQRSEGTELLTHALAYMGFKFQPDVIQLILAKTNYFPGLIQLYCQKLLESMKNNYAGYNEVNTPPYEVTESHIKQVLSDKSFIKEINDRLWMTLTVDEDEGSYYMVIALILAYLYFEQPNLKGYSLADIKEVVNGYELKTIQKLDDDQLNEVLMEMWDLNIITIDNTPDGDRFMFSTESFRDLLGSKEKVISGLEKYSEVAGK